MIRVNSCCCGCSLRTGTLIILWFNLICYLVYTWGHLGVAKHHDFYTIFKCLFFLALPILAIAGIHMRVPAFLIPFMIHQWIYIASLVIIMIGVLLISDDAFIQVLESLAELLDEEIKKGARNKFGKNVQGEWNPLYASDKLTKYKDLPPDGQKAFRALRTLITVVIEFVAGISLILNIYYAIVVLSFFREMMEDEAGYLGTLQGRFARYN